MVSLGSWLHCGYHLTTSIVAPVLLSLPFALALLGWVGGVVCLVLAGLVTFYSYNLLSAVLEHHAQLGQRQLRFRDVASDVLGRRIWLYFLHWSMLIYAISFFILIFFSVFKIRERIKKKNEPFWRLQVKFDLGKEPILNDLSFLAGFIMKIF